jgi:hypothetical protein
MLGKGYSKAAFVDHGYGQVEPNHLSAQRTGQIYAQLPTASDPEITLLENGQFVKYDYAKGEVNFTGAGEWMLVFNEIKLYHEGQPDSDFAMVKGNYIAQVYSPYDYEQAEQDIQIRNYKDIVAPADPYVLDYTENPFAILGTYKARKMADPKAMVPRVLKTNIGDIFTTNTINVAEVNVGDILAPAADGYLAVAGDDATMKWEVVKVYTMPDGQPGAKIMRIA